MLRNQFYTLNKNATLHAVSCIMKIFPKICETLKLTVKPAECFSGVFANITFEQTFEIKITRSAILIERNKLFHF